MKSLAQSEASCWTEDLSDKEDDDKKSLDRSEMCCGQSENDKNDGASQKSDSAYGSRGSIQSPNGRFVRYIFRWFIDFESYLWVIEWVMNYESFFYLEMQCLFHITSVRKIWKISPSSIPVTCFEKRNKIWVIPPTMTHRNSMTQLMTHHMMSHLTSRRCWRRWSDKNPTITQNCEKSQHSNLFQTLKNRAENYRGNDLDPNNSIFPVLTFCVHTICI